MKTYPEMNKEIVELLDMLGTKITTYAARYIEELQAENAELRERLKKSVELPVKIGDKKYCIDCTKTVVLEETVTCVKLRYDGIYGTKIDQIITTTQNNAEEWFTLEKWQSLYDTREAAEARLKEIKGAKQ